MSPELERLLNAIWELETCEPQFQAKWKSVVARLLDDACQKRPGTTREQLRVALKERLDQMRRARRQPPTIPPQA